MNDKRKVIFVGLSGYAYPHTRVRCFHFAQQLARFDGYETEVLSYRDHLAPRYSEAEMFGGVRDLRKIELFLKGMRRLWNQRDALLYVQKAHYHTAAPYVLHRMKRNRYVFDYDDYDVELSVLFRRGTLNRLFFGSRDWLEITKRVAGNARCCVVSSHLLQEILGGWAKDVHLIHTGVDPDAFAYVERDHEKVGVLWTGLVWGDAIFHNVAFLLRAFARAYQHAPNLELRIVGGGQQIDRVRALIADQFAKLPVQLVDWVDPREMPRVLAEADIGALPLIQTDLWTRSKSPTKLFEYMASGLAVVSSPNGEATYVLSNDHDGLLAQNEVEFAAHLATLAQDATKRKALGRQARKTVEEQYSLPVLGEKLRGVIDTCW